MKLRVLTCLLLCAVPAAAAPTKEQVAAAIDAYVRPFVDRGDLSGNLLVARGDEVVYERSFGMANYELGVAVTPETRFNVASVSKPMTVIVLIQLAVDGKLSLDDPLSKWIPGFARGDEITVGHLARHRAGIPHRVTEPCDETVPQTAARIVEMARDKPLTGEPGDAYSYSSAGFSVLARVLELAGGKPFDQLLREAVFDRVGMPHSAHVDARQLLEQRASGYMRSADGGIVNARFQDLSFLVGAGSVYSTARDLHALVHAVRTGQLGPGPAQSSLDENGLDWNGVTNAFRAFADWHRESDVTVVFVGNLQTGAGNLLRADVHRVAAGEEVPAPVLPDVRRIDVAPATLKRWEGRYQLRPGNDLHVHAENGALYANDWVLIPTGERRFYSPQDYAFVDVVLDEAGKPLRLDWENPRGTLPCPRTGDL